MSQILAEIHEYQHIDTEIKKNNKTLAGLRKKRQELETGILTFMENKHKEGIRYDGNNIINKRTKTQFRGKKSEQEEALKKLLSKHGINSISSNTILEVMKNSNKKSRNYIQIN